MIDSVKYHWQAMNEVPAEYGIHVPDEPLLGYIGRPLRSQLKQLGNENGVEFDYDTFSERIAALKQVSLANIQSKEGVVQLLELLKSNNISIAVATSNPKDETQRRLVDARIVDYFNVLVTEDDVTEHKPSPAVYFEAARQINANSLDCILFEDAPAGVQAAKNADMTCIAVRTPFTIVSDLEAADVIVSYLAEADMNLMNNIINKEMAD